MRAQDWSRGGTWRVGEYLVTKRAWERQFDIFHKGRCVHSERTKGDALRWAAKRS